MAQEFRIVEEKELEEMNVQFFQGFDGDYDDRIGMKLTCKCGNEMTFESFAPNVCLHCIRVIMPTIRIGFEPE